MPYTALALLVTAAAVVHYLVVSRVQGVATLDGIFVIAQWVLAVGTMAILDPQDARDIYYSYVVTAPMVIYVLVSIFSYLTNRHPPHSPNRSPRRVEALRPTALVVALIIISIIVTTAYFQAVGYNVFFLGIDSIFTGSTHDYITLRLNSYAGSRYLFPGYVNQFKNVILPSIVVVVVYYLFTTRSAHRKLISGILIVIALVGLLGTGQRGAFIQFTLTFITFLYLVDRSRFGRRALIAAVAVLPCLAFATLLLGRSSAQVSTISAPLAKFQVLGSEIIARFFNDNQVSGQMAFRYTFNLPVQNGAEWLSSLTGLLPGVDTGANLATEVFRMMYGSRRGTSPPSIWGSVYYNFGWAGLVLIPVVLAIAYQSITRRAMHRDNVNSLEVIGMSGVFAILGTWIAGGPEYLLNAGAIAFSMLWLIGRRYGIRRQSFSEPPYDPGLSHPRLHRQEGGYRRLHGGASGQDRGLAADAES